MSAQLKRMSPQTFGVVVRKEFPWREATWHGRKTSLPAKDIGVEFTSIGTAVLTGIDGGGGPRLS